MEREDRHGEKLDRLERALRVVHGMDAPLPTLRMEAIMAGVRASASAPGGDVRFLWRFLSAAAVAAMLLVAVNLWDGATPDAVALNEIVQSPWTVLINPSVLN